MKLLDPQRKFCQLAVSGQSHTEAYLRAYPDCKTRNSAGAAATRLLRNVKVQEEMEGLRAEMETQARLSRGKVREILYKIVMDPTSRGSDVLRAIAEDNKMMGRYEPEKLEVSPFGAMLARVRKKRR